MHRGTRRSVPFSVLLPRCNPGMQFCEHRRHQSCVLVEMSFVQTFQIERPKPEIAAHGVSVSHVEAPSPSGVSVVAMTAETRTAV